MCFNFHKEIPKITRVIGLKVELGKFVSVTVTKAGLVQSTSSHVKSSLPIIIGYQRIEEVLSCLLL